MENTKKLPMKNRKIVRNTYKRKNEYNAMRFKTYLHF